MTDESSVRAALDVTESELGPITSAVNCAGIATAGLTFSKRGRANSIACKNPESARITAAQNLSPCHHVNYAEIMSLYI